MKVIKALTALMLALALGIPAASAQRMALKTNALYWATATPNIDAEMRLGGKWTAELSLGWNPFELGGDRKLKHVAVQPELRRWLCAPWQGHFLAAHLLYSHFNASKINLPLFSELKDYRFQGDLGGIGVGYGYNFLLSPRWSLELEAAIGVVVARYKKYNCGHCGTLIDRATRTKVTPTKLAVNLVYYL